MRNDENPHQALGDNSNKSADEDLDSCIDREVFSELAKIVCIKSNIYNVTIWTKAIPCDGNHECKFDEDESGQVCSLPPDIVFVGIFAGLIAISFLSTCIVTKLKTNRLDHIVKGDTYKTLSDLELMHGKEGMKSIMLQGQAFHDSNELNANFIAMEMKQHHNIRSEMICCIKASNANGT